MDLESECSAVESVEANKVNPDTIPYDDINRITANGTCANDIGQSSDADNAPNTVDTIVEAFIRNDSKSAKPGNSLHSTAQSPAETPSPVTKGYGLKKWRRIRRDFVKDLSASDDTSKILKRALSTSGNQTKPQLSHPETKQSNEGSVGSANTLKNVGNVDGLAFHGSSSNSKFAVGSAFTPGTDSENSEDRSSKSSTAASAPKVRYDLNAVLGYAREKNRIKNISGKSIGSSGQRGHQGRGRVEGSKKPRGERIKNEKENSHSSIESDSRSSCFVFMQGPVAAASNGNQSERSLTDDGDNSDGGYAGEQQFSEEVDTAYRKEDGIEAEDVTLDNIAADMSWKDKEEKERNCWASANKDYLDESIIGLQSAQHALEKEIQKLGEIGKDEIPSCSVLNDAEPSNITYVDSEIHKSSSSSQVDSGKTSSLSSLEALVLSLSGKVKLLETQLEETTAILKSKESRVAELETTINTTMSSQAASGGAEEERDERVMEMEEFEDFFRRKIEAEVEYMAIIKAVEKLKCETRNQILLFEDQKTLANEQVEMINRLGEAENKAATLKERAKGLEGYCDDILETEEVLKTQGKVFKASSCALVQLILLILALWLYVLQLPPHARLVVPT